MRKVFLLLMVIAILSSLNGRPAVAAPPLIPDRIIHLKAQKFFYTPDHITVKQGQRIRIVATSADVVHGFALPEYKINTNIVPDQETIIEFTADKAGDFTFFCSVYCGPGHYSMKGTLTVEEE
jgi:cytochrome c oxidase subunit 2